MLRILADVAKAFDSVADIAAPSELLHQLRFVPPRKRGIDPVGEAEVYLTYQRYKRARQVLRYAKKTEPDNLEAQILLLHTYHLLESSHDYCELATELYPKLIGSPEWKKICQVGRTMAPNHPLFTEEQIQGSR